MMSCKRLWPIVAVLTFTTWAVVAHGQGPREGRVVLGIDHVPVAVSDLDAASDRYRALGFVLKDGRPHPNGITNRHAKFADHTEIELITAPAAVDSLTRYYRDHLAAGDGPAFLALFTSSGERLSQALHSAGFPHSRSNAIVSIAPEHPLRYIFFGGRQASPTDRPEHFAHPNTASGLRRVWLAAADLSAERRLLSAVGARFRETDVSVPEPIPATVAEFPEGSVLLLPGNRQIVPGRKIVGMTVGVRDLRETTRILGSTATPAEPTRVFVPPAAAAGYWLEFEAISGPEPEAGS